VDRKANPVAPATLLISLNGGSSLTVTEDTIMQEAQPTTEPRSWADIEGEFIHSNSQVRSICNALALLYATGDWENLDSDDASVLLHVAWAESKTVHESFYELLTLHIDELKKRKVIEAELNAKPQKPKIETEAEALDHILTTNQYSMGDVSEQLDMVEQS